MLKRLTTTLLALVLSLMVHAQVVPTSSDGSVKADTLSILFRLDSISIDMDFANNRATWDSFLKNFRENFEGKSSRGIRLDIYSGASPEGKASYNRWLGENRGNAVRRLVRRELGNKIGNIIVHNEAARWDGLYDLVAASSEPWRDEVLSIIELPASQDENKRDHREYRLRALRNGSVWPVLLEKYLSKLRSGASAILTWESGRDTVVVRETLVIRDTLVTRDTLVMATPVAVIPDTVPVAAPEPPLPPVTRQPVWILRSNLPFLCIGTLNLQGEWSLDHRDHWSVNVEGMWSWFTLLHNAYANELAYGSAEIRYWLGDRRRHHTLDGFHVGFGLGGGYGDLEWKSKGYQFEYFSGYFNFGWQHRFGKRKQWAFDAGIGLGYAYIPHRRYHGSSIYPESRTEEYDDHLMWLETKYRNWIGPTHLNVSLGYVFTTEKSAFRRASADYRDELNRQFNDASDRLEKRLAAERDSVYRSWLTLPSAERRAAQKAYNNKVKELRKEARKQAVTERKKHKENLKKAKKAKTVNSD